MNSVLVGTRALGLGSLPIFMGVFHQYLPTEVCQSGGKF